MAIAAAVFGWTLLGAACQQMFGKPAAAPVATPAAIDQERLYDLLDAAEDAFYADHLTYPHPSALDHWNTVLQLDPGNLEARRGRERIVERFIERANTAVQRQQYAMARSMLARARLIDPEHPSIAPANTRITLASSAKRSRLDLDGGALQARSASTAGKLANFGKQARGDGCLTYIRARSDAEGRWIYQALKKAPGQQRIRANISISTPPRVELECP